MHLPIKDSSVSVTVLNHGDDLFLEQKQKALLSQPRSSKQVVRIHSLNSLKETRKELIVALLVFEERASCKRARVGGSLGLPSVCPLYLSLKWLC